MINENSSVTDNSTIASQSVHLSGDVTPASDDDPKASKESFEKVPISREGQLCFGPDERILILYAARAARSKNASIATAGR